MENSDLSEKVRENKLRRWAKRLGLKLVKSRAFKIHLDNFGNFQIIDANWNRVLAGSRYELSLDDVENFLTQYEGSLFAK